MEDPTKDELETLNNKNVNAEELNPEDLEDASGGQCDVLTCDGLASCGVFG